MRIPSPANALECCDRARRGLVGDRHDDRVPAGVVDHDLEVLVPHPAVAVVRGTVTAEDTPAAAVRDPAQLLVVLVDERAGVAGDVADGSGRHPVGITQPAEAAPDEDPVDGRWRSSEERTEAVGTVPPARPGGEDLGFRSGIESARRATRS